MEIEFEEWPSVHRNVEEMTMPYNGSVFNLRNAYEEVFKEFVEAEEESERNKEADIYESDDKEESVYRITYNLNLLPSINVPEGQPNLINLLTA